MEKLEEVEEENEDEEAGEICYSPIVIYIILFFYK
jgi:hypothetical protein